MKKVSDNYISDNSRVIVKCCGTCQHLEQINEWDYGCEYAISGEHIIVSKFRRPCNNYTLAERMKDKGYVLNTEK